MASIASLIVRIGANDQEIQNALASVGQKAKSLDADLRKLGNTPLAGQAQKSLESIKETMKQVTDAQQRVAEKAKLAAAGLELMGGASALTNTQLKQVNRTLQEGLSAYSALGKEPPASLQRIATETKNAMATTDGWKNSLKGLAGAIGAAFTVGAVLNFGRDLLRMGDDIVRVADRTGLLTDEVQQLSFIAKQSGNSIDELVGAVGQMQNRLASGDKSAVAAVKALGVSFDELRAAGPYQQLQLIANAIAQIPDPAGRAQVAMDLFGRTGIAILPTLTSEFERLGNAAPKMAHNTVLALDKFGDAMDKFKLQVKVGVAEAYNSLSGFFDKFSILVLKTTGAFMDAVANILSVPLKIPGATSLFPGWQKSLDDLRERAQFARDAAKQLGLGFNEATEGARKAVPVFDGLGESAKNVKTQFESMQEQLFGTAIIANAEMMVKALGSTDNLTRLTAESTKKLNDELGRAIGVYRALGKEVPPALQDIYNKTQPLLQATMSIGKVVAGPGGLVQNFEDLALDALPSTSKLLFQTTRTVDWAGRAIYTQLTIPVIEAGVALDGTSDKIGNFASYLKNDFGKSIVEAFAGGGNVLKTAVSGIGNALFSPEGGLAKSMTKGITKLFGSSGLMGKIGSSIASAIPGIGSLVGLAIEGLGKLIGKFFGTAGRDAVRAFADGMGGFDALQSRLMAMGEEGKRLWISLTQGVGRNNPEEAKRAIAEVTAALDAQKQKFDELQGSIGTVSQKLGAITLITPEIQAALDKVFDEKTTEGYLAAVQNLNAELDKQAKKYDDIKAALDKYGISIKDAGAEFKQMTINSKSQTLLKDFRLLRDAGVDVNAIMRGMGGSVRDFIKEAQAAGVEVPEAMMTLIQTAIDAGEVFDENGEKITDINQLGLKFGTTMETAMKAVSTAVDRLTIVLEGLAKFLGIELPKAAQKGADGIQDALDDIEAPVIRPEIEYPGFAPRGEQSPDDFVPQFASGSGGIRDFGAGTLAVLHGREAVVTEAEMTSASRHASALSPTSTTPVQIVVNFNGSVLAEREYIEREVTPSVLAGVERYFQKQFARLQAMTPVLTHG